MTLLWKLLRHHISKGQLLGFFLANLLGMVIVLLGVQFYNDVAQVFTAEDSFMQPNDIIVAKKIGMGATLSGRASSFSADEQEELAAQPYVQRVGSFTMAQYRVYAAMGVQGRRILSSEIYIESIPDEFVHVDKEQWHYDEGTDVVPVILPRQYINVYNFGYAQANALPKISDGLVGLIDFDLQVGAEHDVYHGRVIGFSSRLSSILVPESFIRWSNGKYAPDAKAQPSRLIMQLSDASDRRFTQYLDDNGYEVEEDQLTTEKTLFFLRLIVTIVIVIGAVISLLSFYILLLSIFLLVQKNAGKMQNLLLMGYAPSRVARPYQWLALGMSAAVLVVAVAVVAVLRAQYMDVVETLFPQLQEGSLMPTLLTGLALLLVVSIVNAGVIYRKVLSIWHARESMA